MDIMYPLGNGSKYNDDELRYSLRSVEKHLKGYDRVFIVGRLPGWLKKETVVHIKVDDVGRKHESIYLKILAAIDAGISPVFQFWNDDHFLLQDLEASELPYFYDNTVEYWANKSTGRYKASCEATWRGLYFDVHTPINYTAKDFISAFWLIDWSDGDPLIKSTYGNACFVHGRPISDLKINGTYTVEQIKAMIHGRMFFSIGNYSLYPEMRKVLNELYPNKSKYEK
jgi:hypothetical protein